uniref:Uncharacterized protein n=1 Tax=Leersia perrieri TaxID=77586 RepID=A0A0D9XH85_9ORYZ
MVDIACWIPPPASTLIRIVCAIHPHRIPRRLRLHDPFMRSRRHDPSSRRLRLRHPIPHPRATAVPVSVFDGFHRRTPPSLSVPAVPVPSSPTSILRHTVAQTRHQPPPVSHHPSFDLTPFLRSNSSTGRWLLCSDGSDPMDAGPGGSGHGAGEQGGEEEHPGGRSLEEDVAAHAPVTSGQFYQMYGNHDRFPAVLEDQGVTEQWITEQRENCFLNQRQREEMRATWRSVEETVVAEEMTKEEEIRATRDGDDPGISTNFTTTVEVVLASS